MRIRQCRDLMFKVVMMTTIMCGIIYLMEDDSGDSDSLSSRYAEYQRRVGRSEEEEKRMDKSALALAKKLYRKEEAQKYVLSSNHEDISPEVFEIIMAYVPGGKEAILSGKEDAVKRMNELLKEYHEKFLGKYPDNASPRILAAGLASYLYEKYGWAKKKLDDAQMRLTERKARRDKELRDELDRRNDPNPNINGMGIENNVNVGDQLPQQALAFRSGNSLGDRDGHLVAHDNNRYNNFIQGAAGNPVNPNLLPRYQGLKNDIERPQYQPGFKQLNNVALQDNMQNRNPSLMQAGVGNKLNPELLQQYRQLRNNNAQMIQNQLKLNQLLLKNQENLPQGASKFENYKLNQDSNARNEPLRIQAFNSIYNPAAQRQPRPTEVANNQMPGLRVEGMGAGPNIPGNGPNQLIGAIGDKQIGSLRNLANQRRFNAMSGFQNAVDVQQRNQGEAMRMTNLPQADANPVQGNQNRAQPALVNRMFNAQDPQNGAQPVERNRIVNFHELQNNEQPALMNRMMNVQRSQNYAQPVGVNRMMNVGQSQNDAQPVGMNKMMNFHQAQNDAQPVGINRMMNVQESQNDAQPAGMNKMMNVGRHQNGAQPVVVNRINKFHQPQNDAQPVGINRMMNMQGSQNDAQPVEMNIRANGQQPRNFADANIQNEPRDHAVGGRKSNIVRQEEFEQFNAVAPGRNNKI